MDSIGRPLLLIGVLLFAGPPGHAQGRHGVWMEAGMGYGSASFSCDTCDRSQRLGGYSVTVALGGTLSQHVRLGGDYRNWFNGLKPSGPLAGISTIELVLSYYPRIRGGPFVEASGGLSLYNLGKGTGDIIDPYSSDTTYYSGTGRGFTLAAGWEFPIRPIGFRWHLAYHRGAVRRLHTPDGATVATGWKQNLLTVELRILIGASR
jgi:hypothetical protein